MNSKIKTACMWLFWLQITYGKEPSAFEAVNPFLPPSSVDVKVESLSENDGERSQDWIIFTITDDIGVPTEVMGLKLEQDRSLTIPRQVFCRWLREVLLDGIMPFSDNHFLMPPQHPAAEFIRNQASAKKQAPVVEMNQNKTLRTWLLGSKSR